MDDIIEDTRIVYTWKVDLTCNKYSHRYEVIGSTSCQFPQSGKYANKFCLTFNKNTDNKYYSYYLSRPSSDIPEIDVFFFMLKNNHENGSQRFLERKLTCICSNNQPYKLGFTEYLNQETLYSFMSNNSITLGCEIIFCEQLIHLSTTNSLLHYRSMQDQFEQLLISDELSDFTIVVDAQEIKVHRAILAARSAVFKTMLTINMAEKKDNRLKIEDIDLKILKVMIKFMYTNKIDEELDSNEAEQLLIRADEYQLEDLKDLCTYFLKKSLSIENISQYMLLAARYKSKSLMDAVTEVMKCSSSAIDIACNRMLKHF